MARRVRRRFRGGRVVDLGGGHGLLAQVMLLLDDSSPGAVVVDKALPPSGATLHDALVQAWPRFLAASRLSPLRSTTSKFFQPTLWFRATRVAR